MCKHAWHNLRLYLIWNVQQFQAKNTVLCVQRSFNVPFSPVCSVEEQNPSPPPVVQTSVWRWPLNSSLYPWWFCCWFWWFYWFSAGSSDTTEAGKNPQLPHTHISHWNLLEKSLRGVSSHSVDSVGLAAHHLPLSCLTCPIKPKVLKKILQH